MTPLEPRKAGRRALSSAVVAGLTIPVSAGVVHAQESEEPAEENVEQAQESNEGDTGAEEDNDTEDTSDEEDSDDEESDSQQDEESEPEPEPEPQDEVVTAEHPYEAGENRVGIPDVAGVTYTLGGESVSGTIDVPEGGASVVAVADDGYELTGQSDFFFDYSEPEPEPEPEPEEEYQESDPEDSEVQQEEPEPEEEQEPAPEPSEDEEDASEPADEQEEQEPEPEEEQEPAPEPSEDEEEVSEPADEQEEPEPEPEEEQEDSESDDEQDDDEEDEEPQQETEVFPLAPSHDHENNTVDVPEVEGVEYSETGTVDIPEDGLTITASAEEGYELGEGAATSWSYDYTEDLDEVDPSFEVVGTILRGSSMDPESDYTVTLSDDSGQAGTTTISASANGTTAYDLADIGSSIEAGDYTVEVEGSDGFAWSGSVTFEDDEDQEGNPEVSVDGTTVSISNGQPEAEYTIAENGNSTTVTTDSEGNASANVEIALDLEPGDYTLFVYGPGQDDEEWSDSVSVTVEDDQEEIDQLSLSADTEQVEDGQSVTFDVEATNDNGDPVEIDTDDVNLTGLEDQDEADGLTVTFNGEGERNVTAVYEETESNTVTITVDDAEDYDPQFSSDGTVVSGADLVPEATYEVEVSWGWLPVGSTEITADSEGNGSADIADAGDLTPGSTYTVTITGPDDFETTLEITVPDDDDPGDPDPEIITPEDPTHTPAENVVEVPEQEGVEWSHGPGTVQVPEDGITITASPEDGYEFDDDAQTEWSYEFVPDDDDPGDPDPETVTAETPGRDANTVSIPSQTGVIYTVDGNTVTGTIEVPESGLTVTAVATEGYQLEGQSAWFFEFATDPDDPEDPVDPDDPTDPEDPDDPEEPTDPEDPEEPVDPEDPEDPTDPGDPGDGEDPGEGDQPGDDPGAEPEDPESEGSAPDEDPVAAGTDEDDSDDQDDDEEDIDESELPVASGDEDDPFGESTDEDEGLTASDGDDFDAFAPTDDEDDPTDLPTAGGDEYDAFAPSEEEEEDDELDVATGDEDAGSDDDEEATEDEQDAQATDGVATTSSSAGLAALAAFLGIGVLGILVWLILAGRRNTGGTEA